MTLRKAKNEKGHSGVLSYLQFSVFQAIGITRWLYFIVIPNKARKIVDGENQHFLPASELSFDKESRFLLRKNQHLFILSSNILMIRDG